MSGTAGLLAESASERVAGPDSPRGSPAPPALQLQALPGLIGNRAMARVAQQLQRQAASQSGLTAPMLAQIARRLRSAMEGWGTDEEAIYSALSGRTQDQVDAIAQTYRAMYRRDLIADLRDELTDSELRHLAIFNPQTPRAAPGAPPPRPTAAAAEQAAAQLRTAMAGWGTDESAIFAALTGRTRDEREAIKAAYSRRYRRSLEADLRDEMSGSELTEALRLLNQGELTAADELHLAMTGLGTDEGRVFRVLESMHGDAAAINAMEQDYRRKYGDLIADLRGDMSGSDLARAMRTIRPTLQNAAFEHCNAQVIPKVRSLLPMAIAKTDKAIQVLSQGWAHMTADQRRVFNQYFDPNNTGGVDDQFVRDVLSNFRAIRRQFEGDLTFECMPPGGTCTGTRLYYTHWGNIFVCPYFTTEPSDERRARDIVHELGHNAMKAVDRPYFGDDTSHLSPRGRWMEQVPVLGYGYRLVGGIVHLAAGPDANWLTDTLYHPDAYSWFAFRTP